MEGVDAEFLVEDVETIVKNALQTTLSEVQYDHEKVAAWTNQVIDACLKGLQGLGKPFKYVVTCILMQKNGAGLHTAAGAFWDTKKDGEEYCERVTRSSAREFQLLWLNFDDNVAGLNSPIHAKPFGVKSRIYIQQNAERGIFVL